MMIELYNGDCLEWLKTIESKSIDLIVTDPPYDIPNTKAGKSAWQESIQKMNTEITQAGLTKGYDHENIIPELIRVMKRINIYIYGATVSKSLCTLITLLKGKNALLILLYGISQTLLHYLTINI